MAQFEIYTDGSHKGQWGSWAYVILENQQLRREASGRQEKTDSNRMEFQAAIEALQTLPLGVEANLYSDSRLMLEAVNQFSIWSANNWLKKNGRPIPNDDLFKIILTLISVRKITWHWVHAHTGHVYNELCDEMCTRAREQNSPR